MSTSTEIDTKTTNTNLTSLANDVKKAKKALRKAAAISAVQAGGWIGGVFEYQRVLKDAGLPALIGDENFEAACAAYQELEKEGRKLAPQDGWEEPEAGDLRQRVLSLIEYHRQLGDTRPMRNASMEDPCCDDRPVVARDGEGRCWYGALRGRSVMQSCHNPWVEPLGWLDE